MAVMTIRVFLADDHEVVRRGVRDLIDHEDDMSEAMTAGAYLTIDEYQSQMAERADTETTLAELRARVAATLSDLATFTEADFADLSQNTVTQPRWQGKVMSAHDYFLEHVLPNFYFHATTAYAILRHNGVPLGKKDFLGERTMRQP